MMLNRKGVHLTKMKISSKLLNIIRQNKSFLIVCHINPEGDAIGSISALALGLKKIGKKDICVLSKDGVPEILKFLPSSGLIKQKAPKRTITNYLRLFHIYLMLS